MSMFPLLALPDEVIGLVSDCLSSDDRTTLSFVNRACYKAIRRRRLPIVFLALLDGTLTRNGIVTHVDSLDTANDANYIFEIADDSPGDWIIAYNIFPRWFDQLPGLRIIRQRWDERRMCDWWFIERPKAPITTGLPPLPDTEGMNSDQIASLPATPPFLVQIVARWIERDEVPYCINWPYPSLGYNYYTVVGIYLSHANEPMTMEAQRMRNQMVTFSIFAGWQREYSPSAPIHVKRLVITSDVNLWYPFGLTLPRLTRVRG